MAKDFSLMESGKEFMKRYQSNDSTLTPMLSSACPGIFKLNEGWICYAEKTHGQVLPLIDSTKSPQQIMGCLIKYYIGNQLGLSPEKIYHVAVMPCFDKKLEASRNDFYSDIYRTRDVDCVITTGELEHMLIDQNINIRTCPEISSANMYPIANFSFNPLESSSMIYRSEGSSSGGFLSYILRFAAYHIHGITLSPDDVTFGTHGVSILVGRNSDFTEILFTPPNSNQATLKFAYCYGFKNLQTVIRKIKPKAGGPRRAKSETITKYDFIEVMACPSGCINGGGQLKPEEKEIGTNSDWILQAQKSFFENAELRTPDSNPAVELLYQKWLGNDEAKIQTMLHTQYRAVDSSLQSPLAVKW